MVARQVDIQALQAEGIPCSGGYGYSLNHQPLFRNKAFGPYLERASARLDYAGLTCPNSDLICREQGFWIDQSVLLGPRSDMDDILRAMEKVHDNRVALRDWAGRTGKGKAAGNRA